MTLWCPPNKLEWYKAKNLSTQFFGMTRTAASLSGVVFSLHKEFSSKYLSANAPGFLIATFEDGFILGQI